jgi:hypothetical protein
MWGRPISVRGKEEDNGSGRERVVGHGPSFGAGRILPWGLFPFSKSFLFFKICFIFGFCLKVFAKTSDLPQAKILQVVKLSLCY